MTTSQAFATCSLEAQDTSDAMSVMQCVAASLEQQNQKHMDNMTSWLFVLAGAIVFFMQAGFAMLCAGCVRKKNVHNTMLKNFLDACGAAIAYFVTGYAFSFGGQNDTTDITFVGTKNFVGIGIEDQGFFFFQYAFCATAVTIVAGTLAERCQMGAYIWYSLFLTGFVYPVVVHSVWSNNGFLSAFAAEPFRGVGTVDFAGSGVIHLTGGTTSLIATWILGARRGRFHDGKGNPLEKPREMAGHSIALQLMGTMVLWFGWYGFNAGSALALTATEDKGAIAGLAAVNTSLSAASGAISSLFMSVFLTYHATGDVKFNLTKTMNGLLGALVAITAGCGTVENWAACIIGGIGGLLYLAGSQLLLAMRLDDAVDAIPVHLVNGLWGMLATGLLSSPDRLLAAFGQDDHVGWFYSVGRGSFDATLLGNQVIAILFILGWTCGTMLPFFFFLNYMGWFRSDSLQELIGLDMSCHGAVDLTRTITSPNQPKGSGLDGGSSHVRYGRHDMTAKDDTYHGSVPSNVDLGNLAHNNSTHSATNTFACDTGKSSHFSDSDPSREEV